MKITKLYAAFVAAMVFSVIQTSAQVTGSGTAGTVPVWVGTTKLGNSVIVQSSGNVGIGTKKPSAKFNVVTTSKTAAAIYGNADATSGNASGISGVSASTTGFGVSGFATATTGQTYGVFGGSSSPSGYGVSGVNSAVGGYGVNGDETATSGFSTGVIGQSHSSGGDGVFGVNFSSSGGTGVGGDIESTDGTGAAGLFVAHGGAGLILNGVSGSSFTRVFSVDAEGNGFFAGKLSKGSGSFKIDHPLDPANKYLEHSFVESPDMMNIYNGIVVLDSKGEGAVSLPDYFQALNSDFRYQLTAIGAPGPNLYIAAEISGNRFKIAGGKAGSKVSWQVTGIRQDAYAAAHRIKVEEEKPAQERGHYLHPELFGATEREAIGNQPEATLPAIVTVANAAGMR
jgi:trimeric autotransporter adhesin